MNIYIYVYRREKSCEKVGEKGKRECAGAPTDGCFLLRSTEDRHFSNLTDSSPNLVQLSARNPSRIFSKICPYSQFPDSRLKLGSSDANSSNVINHTADFWTALRRPAKIREISQFLLYYCILKIGWYIYFFFLRTFGEIFVTILL